jgi:alpha-tubulin suppressor-like RCC1 family protein
LNDILTDASAIAAGMYHTCALTKTGAVRCWGGNAYGQVGDGTFVDRFAPSSEVLTGVRAVTCGDYHTCALMNAGGVRCWGDNYDGQLGNGVPRYFTSALPVLGTCQ